MNKQSVTAVLSPWQHIATTFTKWKLIWFWNKLPDMKHSLHVCMSAYGEVNNVNPIWSHSILHDISRCAIHNVASLLCITAQILDKAWFYLNGCCIHIKGRKTAEVHFNQTNTFTKMATHRNNNTHGNENWLGQWQVWYGMRKTSQWLNV